MVTKSATMRWFQLSQIVSMQIRNTDLLARWGGEEFVILSPGSDGEMARQAADKLAAAIERTLFDEVGTITCSFGITQHAHSDSADTLIARADLALYRAKTSGRNRGGIGADAGRGHRRGVGRVILRCNGSRNRLTRLRPARILPRPIRLRPARTC